ncbi:MAG: hypothetical protein AAGI92_11440 [Pseudomonadota bacterium]
MKSFTLAFALFFAGVGLAYCEALTSIHPDGPGEYTMSVNDLDVHVSIQLVGETEETSDWVAKLTIYEDGAQTFQHEFEDYFSPVFGPIAHIVEMDDTNGSLEVVAATYSGGAHCCTQPVVMTKTGGDWKLLPAGSFDGDFSSVSLSDLDGDGLSELQALDIRFFYEFAPYAGSFAPIQILGMRDGEVKDVTSEEVYEWSVRDAFGRIITIPDNGEERNSWLATYAAYLLLLGEDDPLDFALASHDASVDWGMTKCTVEEVDFVCPDGKSENVGFEAALTEFLTETGYLR